MAQYQVTVDGEILQQLFVRDDGLARLAEQVLNQVLEAQATEQLGARRYERTEERQGYRNGHRDKTLNTRVGRLVLAVPRLRSGEFSMDLFRRYLPAERAGAAPGDGGDGGERGFDAQGAGGRRETVRDGAVLRPPSRSCARAWMPS